jgi:hypothetical protein
MNVWCERAFVGGQPGMPLRPPPDPRRTAPPRRRAIQAVVLDASDHPALPRGGRLDHRDYLAVIIGRCCCQQRLPSSQVVREKGYQRGDERKQEQKYEHHRHTASARCPLFEVTRRRYQRYTGSSKRLPDLWQIVSRDRKPDLPAAGLCSDDYPVPVDKKGRCLTECNGRLAPRKHKLAQRQGRGDHKGVRTDDQSLWTTQGNPHTAGAPESASAKDAGTVKGSSKGRSRLYLVAQRSAPGTQRSVPGAFTVSPDKEIRDHAEDCSCDDELHNHAPCSG